MSLFTVVLVEPEIPNNTGNIGRTCVGTGSRLHLIQPLGFEIQDKQLKRAGLDYWPNLNWEQFGSWSQWESSIEKGSRFHLFSTKAEKSLFEADFQMGDFLIFGKETKGLDTRLLAQYPDQVYGIPMPGAVRSLNLANAVSIAVYEGFRQLQVRGEVKDPFAGGHVRTKTVE